MKKRDYISMIGKLNDGFGDNGRSDGWNDLLSKMSENADIIYDENGKLKENINLDKYSHYNYAKELVLKKIKISFLINILKQNKPSDLIKKNEEKVFNIIPELKLCKGFNQNNIWHIYDVYEHILHVVDNVPNNIILRMAALFHDIGKPYVYKEDENNVGHFYNHWHKSKEIFEKFSEEYNLEDNIKNKISNLILYHDLNIDKINDKELENLITIFGKDDIIILFQLKRSDLLAQNEQFHHLLNDYEKQQDKILKIIKR